MKNNKNTTHNPIDNGLPRLSDPALWDRIRDWHQTLYADKALTARIAASGVLLGEDASPLISEYLRFAYLAWISPDGATPSKAVDEAWHAHLLFTRRYESFCEATRGELLHHDPGDGEEGDGARFEAAYLATLDRYEDEFGHAPERWWPRPAAPAKAAATAPGVVVQPPAPPARPSPIVVLATCLLPVALGIWIGMTAGAGAGIAAAMVGTGAVMLVMSAGDWMPGAIPDQRRDGKPGKGDSGSGGCSGGFVPAGDVGAACGDGGGGGGGDGGSCGSSCGGGGCGGGGGGGG